MPSHTLNMKVSLPGHVENRLVNKWGYAVDKRVLGHYIIFSKSYVSDKKIGTRDDGVKRTIRASVLDFKNQLTTIQKKALEKRCDNIVSFFDDPYSVPKSVRARLSIIMQGLPLAEAQFVLEYMDENFPVKDEGA